MKNDISLLEIKTFLWGDGDLKYKLDTLQLSIQSTVEKAIVKSKKVCVLSSRQIGKSYWVVVFAVQWLLKNPGKICRIIAPTREACSDIVEDNLNKIIADAPLGLITKNASKNRWTLSNGASLRLGALERQYVDKNRGGNAGLIIYEECGFVKSDDFTYGVNSVISPQLMRSNGVEVFITSPSEQPDHPVHTDIAPRCEIDGTLFNYMVFHSPSISIPKIIEAAERAGSTLKDSFVEHVLSEIKIDPSFNQELVHELAKEYDVYLSDDFRRELLAEIIRPKTLMVIPEWNENKTVLEFISPRLANYIITIDWGGVRDRTVGLLMGYEPTTDEDIVIDECVFEPNIKTDLIVRKLKEMEKFHALEILQRWADVPGQLRVDLKREHNYDALPPQKTNWLASVNNMASRFARNKIKIHKRCKFLIASIKSGMFNKTRTDFERTKALGHLDAIAALMYGIRSQDRTVRRRMPALRQPDNKMIRIGGAEDEGNLSAMTGRRFGAFKKR